MELREKISKLFVDKDEEFRKCYLKEEMDKLGSEINMFEMSPDQYGLDSNENVAQAFADVGTGGIGALAGYNLAKNFGKNPQDRLANGIIGAGTLGGTTGLATHLYLNMLKESSAEISGLAPALLGGAAGAALLGKGMQNLGNNVIEKDRNTAVGATAGAVGGAGLAQILSIMHPELTEGTGV